MVGGERAAALVILCFERAEEWFETKSSALSNGIKRNQNEREKEPRFGYQTQVATGLKAIEGKSAQIG